MATIVFGLSALFGLAALIGVFGAVDEKTMLIVVTGIAGGCAISGVPWPARLTVGGTKGA